MEETKEIGKGKVVVLFYPPMFLICEASPWPPDPIVGVVHASFICILQQMLVQGPGGQPVPKIGLNLLGDMDLTPGSWAGVRPPDPEELREFETFRMQFQAQKSNIVLAGPGAMRGMKGGRH